MWLAGGLYAPASRLRHPPTMPLARSYNVACRGLVGASGSRDIRGHAACGPRWNSRHARGRRERIPGDPPDWRRALVRRPRAEWPGGLHGRSGPPKGAASPKGAQPRPVALRRHHPWDRLRRWGKDAGGRHRPGCVAAGRAFGRRRACRRRRGAVAVAAAPDPAVHREPCARLTARRDALSCRDRGRRSLRIVGRRRW